MNYKNNIIFLNNKLNNKNIDELEIKAFTINKKLLKTKEQIIQEYIKLMAFVANDVELEYDDYQNLLNLLNNVGIVIDNYEELNNIDISVLKKIIVYIDLLIDYKVSFYSTFITMYNNKELDIYCNKFDYDYLYNHFKHSTLISNYYKDFRYKVYHICKKLEHNKEIEKEYLNYYELKQDFDREYYNLRVRISLDKTDYSRYYDFYKLLEDLKVEIDNNELDDDLILFIKKVINYIDIEYDVDIKYPKTFVNMLCNDELDINYKELKFNNKFNLEYLKQKFNYNRGLSYGK